MQQTNGAQIRARLESSHRLLLIRHGSSLVFVEHRTQATVGRARFGLFNSVETVDRVATVQ